MSLNDIKVRTAKPKAKPYRLADGNGLTLYLHPNGGKYWRMRYRWAGKEKQLALGVYPDIGLADARIRCGDARKVLANGKDPAEIKKEVKREILVRNANSFESVAREWVEARSTGWTPRYTEFMIKRMEKDILPKLGSRPIKDITAPELLAVLRLIEKRGASELAQRSMQYCGQIFMYGIATGRADRNPAADLKGSLKTHVKQNYAHLKEVDLPEFIQKLEAYDGNLQTKLAVKMLMHTFVRTTELRGAEWSEIDFDKAEWRITPERMKMRRGHIVPLSRQVIEILRELQTLNGKWQYVFPNPFKPIKFMSENAVLYALYRMGYHNRTTGHGFRHTASTILNENGFNADHIERQLAHVEANKVRGAYNHAEYMQERRKMMQWWSDYIDAQKESANAEKAA
jgi:integrase